MSSPSSMPLLAVAPVSLCELALFTAALEVRGVSVTPSDFATHYFGGIGNFALWCAELREQNPELN